jgi:hypothetical protein
MASQYAVPGCGWTGVLHQLHTRIGLVQREIGEVVVLPLQ